MMPVSWYLVLIRLNVPQQARIQFTCLICQSILDISAECCKQGVANGLPKITSYPTNAIVFAAPRLTLDRMPNGRIWPSDEVQKQPAQIIPPL